MQHHDEAVRGAAARYPAYPGAVALILGGSVARGTERSDSDVDLTLVLTDAAYGEHAASDRLSFVDEVPEFYDHAYFDVKVVTVEQLRLAVDSGDDPMRGAYLDARVLWAESAAVEREVRGILDSIVDPPGEHWIALERSFLAQARLHGGYFLEQSEQLDLGLLRHHAAVHFAFAIGRALLARNRVLFSGPKYLERDLGALATAPSGIARRLRSFLDAPTAEEAAAILAEVEGLGDWTLAREQSLSVFVEDNELAWLTGRMPPEYR